MDVMAESACTAAFSSSSTVGSLTSVRPSRDSDSVGRDLTPGLRDLPEETLNQITHGAGFGLSVLGAVYLLTHTGTDMVVQLGCWVYAIALVALYASSTLSHSFDCEPRRTRYRTLDQIAIFTVMAATFTPVSLQACRDGWWNLPLILMWLTAGLGIYLKLRVTKHQMVPVWFYVVLGSIPAVTLPRLQSVLGPDAMFWMIAGGVCYLVGIVFLTNDHRSRIFHPIWHLLVIMGSLCHYIMICDHAVKAA